MAKAGMVFECQPCLVSPARFLISLVHLLIMNAH